MITSKEIQSAVQGQTVATAFVATVASQGDQVALRWKNADDSWSEKTYSEYAADVARAASGLANLGVGRGDRVMMMIRNRHEFHVIDVAAVMLGATPVSIYNSSSVDQVKYLCGDAEAKIILVEDQGFLDIVSEARSELPSVEAIGCIEAADDKADFTYESLLASESMDLIAASQTAQVDDLATLIYTSGTTGPSKGVMLDHTNIMWTAECLRQSLGLDEQAGLRLISYLPMAHIAERITGHYQALISGMEVTCCPDPRQIAEYAKQVHPQIIFGVPRIWEKIYAGVNAALSLDPEKAQKVAEAVEAAAPIKERMTLGTASQEDIETYDFLDAVAFSTIRGLIGLDDCVSAISGAAPIPPEILAWFRTIGVPLSEIYGLSETCGPLTWEPYRVKPGLVGIASPGIEVKLDTDGEVMCRGGNVFRGYLNLPEKTAEVLDSDGWFRSGDIGEFDDEGYLKIVDRKKELIITAGGKNLSPANLELRLKLLPLVGQACAIGDKRPFVSALVVLDPDSAPQWAAVNGIEYSSMAELAEHPDLIAKVEGGLAEAMEGFNNTEKVKKLVIIGEEWQPDTELLTPTGKLKRRGVNEVYAKTIETIYQK